MDQSVNQKSYDQIKNDSYTFYAQIKPVFCPHLKQQVVFTGKGFWHITYRSHGKKREESAQILRFRLIKKAVKLISTTSTIQEYNSVTSEIPMRDHGKKVMKLVTLQFFGYIAIIDGWKLKIIVRKDGNGKPYFWSLIPNWVTNKKRDIRYQNFTGNLKED